jgi:hypothetical protein
MRRGGFIPPPPMTDGIPRPHSAKDWLSLPKTLSVLNLLEVEVGKLADLVVLGRDPFKEDPYNLINIPIERTMTGGKWVYES